MGKLTERAKQCPPFSAPDAQFSTSKLLEVVSERELLPVEKLWVELGLFNELYTRFDGLVEIDEEFLDKIFPGKIAESVAEELAIVVENIYKRYKPAILSAKAGQSQSLATGFRIITIMQDFEGTYSKKYLDNLYIPKGFDPKARSQMSRIKPALWAITLSQMRMGVAFNVDGVEKETLQWVIRLTKVLKNQRFGDELLW